MPRPQNLVSLHVIVEQCMKSSREQSCICVVLSCPVTQVTTEISHAACNRRVIVTAFNIVSEFCHIGFKRDWVVNCACCLCFLWNLIFSMCNNCKNLYQFITLKLAAVCLKLFAYGADQLLIYSLYWFLRSIFTPNYSLTDAQITQ